MPPQGRHAFCSIDPPTGRRLAARQADPSRDGRSRLPGNLRNIDWSQVCFPSVSAIEVVVRGSVVYLSLFLMLRLISRRQPGAMSITDLLVIVLIADAAQSVMS